MTKSEPMSRYGTALIVSGPSGVGKGTICGEINTHFPNLQFSVSCTTRSPRPGEIEGKHYYFIDKTVFEEKIAAGEFIEYAEVFGNYYGTLRSEVVNHIKNGRDVLLDIDIQGAMQIKKHATNNQLLKRCCEFIFIVPPNLQELEQRLRGRNTETEAVIQQRLAKSEHELSFWPKYDYIIINDTVEAAVARMQHIINALHCSTSRYE